MKNVLYIFIFLFALNSFSQGEANVWYFGHNAGLDFNTPNPTALTNGQLDTFEGCSSFSDSNGNLLFYSDGRTVWNRNHVPMPNGTNLKGDSSSSQSAMIIPYPGNPMQYFIFTVGAPSSGNAGFFYYTIDMTLDGGLGEIIVGSETNLMQGENASLWTEKVAAVKGDACDTFWVVSYARKNAGPDEFFAYKVTTSGVVISSLERSSASFNASDARGYLKISPDGTKLAVAHMGDAAFMLYDFDDVNGIVSNGIILPLTTAGNKPYGVEFSANSEKLYVHASNDYFANNGSQNNPSSHFSTLFQFDISLPTTPGIIASRTIIDSQNLYRGALQLGPDHKIYRALSQTYATGFSTLGVIENPEADGVACNYQHASISLGGATSSQGLPPFISSIFSQIEITADDSNGNTSVVNNQIYLMCTGDNLSITPETITLPGTTVYNWFKDGLPYSNSANLTFLNVSPTDNGIYILDAEFTDTCGNQITLEAEFELAVYDIPTATTPPNIIECDDDNNGTFPFDLLQQDVAILNGQRNTNFEVLYFASQADADANMNQITSPYESGTATIYGRVQAIGNPNCYDTTSFDIELYESAFPVDSATMTALRLCDDTSVGTLDDGFVITDLTQKETEILNNQSATDFTLTYFTDATFIPSSQITTPSAFQNTTVGGQIIYVRMSNNLPNATACFTDTSFELEIYEQPIALTPSTMILCDDDNNGTMPFDLTSQDSFINTVVGMTITYHPTQTDADANTNPTSSPFESATTTIYARVENDLNTDCYDTTFFNIEVYDSAFPLDAASILPIQECDNTSYGTDIDGIIVFDLTQQETDILNGQSATDFTLTYFEDATYIPTSKILNPATYTNTVIGGQIIYVRMTNNIEDSCYTDTSFEIEVFELPVIQSTYIFKNCDEDGNPDGLTDYNLDEANEFITNGDTNLIVTYYLSFADADTATGVINPSPFNNASAINNTVYARIENLDGCYRVSTINLQVSTTSFPPSYIGEELFSCDDDDTIDGLHVFDLTDASANLIAQFPDPNLSVHYFRDLNDAQLEQNEISPQNSYMSEEPFSQTIYVRIESDTNGDCFGVGPFLTLTVYPRPEFEVDPTAIVCLNLPPITLEIYNPQGNYTYQWTNESGTVISNEPTTQVSQGGDYTVIATSGLNCESFPHTVSVSESIIATINLSDITVTDDSDNNTITIDTTNLGIGDYEFSLDEEFGIYQDEPFFDRVAPGVHTVFVKDKNNCGVAPLGVSVIGFPKFFTPNNDGENDDWQVKGVDTNFYASSLIYIYDRFGKMIAKVDPTENGWDGFYNGEALPSTDYWFTAQLIDQDGNVRNRKGHFSLIRR